MFWESAVQWDRGGTLCVCWESAVGQGRDSVCWRVETIRNHRSLQLTGIWCCLSIHAQSQRTGWCGGGAVTEWWGPLLVRGRHCAVGTALPGVYTPARWRDDLPGVLHVGMSLYSVAMAPGSPCFTRSARLAPGHGGTRRNRVKTAAGASLTRHFQIATDASPLRMITGRNAGGLERVLACIGGAFTVTSDDQSA